MPRPRELRVPARGGGAAGEPRTLTPSPLAPSSYSHALDGMYRVLREGEAVPAGAGRVVGGWPWGPWGQGSQGSGRAWRLCNIWLGHGPGRAWQPACTLVEKRDLPGAAMKKHRRVEQVGKGMNGSRDEVGLF